jgi:hypothetical protein
MIQRKTVPAYGHCDIALATEQMSDGKWAVVATVKHSTGTAQQSIDLPVSHERFDSQADAENHGIRMAKAWIDENTPKEVGQPRRD